MIELTVRLTDEQLVEIAERAAALIPTGAPAVSPWLNVAEPLSDCAVVRTGSTTSYPLASSTLAATAAASYCTATISIAMSKDELHDLPVVGVTRWLGVLAR